MPCAPGVRTSSAPYARSRLAALHAHGLRHGQHHAVPARGGDHGERDAGVAAGRLHDGRLVRRDEAGLLGGVDHREADAVLDAAAGVERLQLPDDRRAGALGEAAQLDQRRAADQGGDIVCDLHVSAPLVVAVRSRTWARRRTADVRARRDRSRWCGPARPDRRCRRRARPSPRPRGSSRPNTPCWDGSRREAPSSASTTSSTVSRSGRRAKVKPPPTPRWPVTRPARRRPAKSCSRYCSGMPRSAARSTSRTGRLWPRVRRSSSTSAMRAYLLLDETFT